MGCHVLTDYLTRCLLAHHNVTSGGKNPPVLPPRGCVLGWTLHPFTPESQTPQSCPMFLLNPGLVPPAGSAPSRRTACPAPVRGPAGGRWPRGASCSTRHIRPRSPPCWPGTKSSVSPLQSAVEMRHQVSLPWTRMALCWTRASCQPWCSHGQSQRPSEIWRSPSGL